MSRLLLLPLLVLFTTATGCSSSSPIKAWQSHVEDFIQHSGNGDPNVLRSTAIGAEHPQIGALRAAGGRTDANGVLLGHKQVGQENWYIFLVGVVRYQGGPYERPRVKDIRVAAMSANDGRYHWAVGSPSNTSVDGYVARQHDRWTRDRPPSKSRRAAPSVFPHEDDDYRLVVNGSTVTVEEATSDAFWTLQLGAQQGGSVANANW